MACWTGGGRARWRSLPPLPGVAVEAALQVQVAPAQVQDLAAPPAGKQIGEHQRAQTEAGSRAGRNYGQQLGHLLGVQTSSPGLGLPPRWPDPFRGIVLTQAFPAGPAVEASHA